MFRTKKHTNHIDAPPDLWEVQRQPTTAADWKAGVVVQLTDSFTARLRPISWEVLAENKDIPEELISIVAAHMDEGGGSVILPMKTLKDRLLTRKFLKNLSVRMFVEPIVSYEPKEGELHPDDLEDEVLYTLGSLIGAGTALLKSFRPAEAETLLSLVKRLELFQAALGTPESGTSDQGSDAGTGGVVDTSAV